MKSANGCDGCIFQKYRMTDEGVVWFCMMESKDLSEPIMHKESAVGRKCQFIKG